MARRRGFETSLTSSSSAPSSKPNGRAAAALPPRIPTPAADHAMVPTEREVETPQAAGNVAPAAGPELDDDSGTCFICAEPITFWSTGVCGHKTCHVCALRLRILYKKKDCTYCKTVQPSLIFSRSPNATFPVDHQVEPSPEGAIEAAKANADKLAKGQRWDDGLTLPGKLDMSAFKYSDEQTSVVFEDEDMRDATLLLLRFNCPYPDCPHMADGWQSLQKHTMAIHHLTLCTLCCRQLLRFSHEQVLYPPYLLPLHDPSRLQRGQRPPKPRGKDIELARTWDAPHPMCEFCHEAFFGPDELFAHMRTKHDECFVCKDLGERDVYFQNYAKLEEHFNADHFPCRQPACLEQKFVVFGSELDLRAHMIETHKGAMSAREQAQSRQINVDFSDQSHHRGGAGPSRGGGGGHHGRGFTMQSREAPHQQQITAPTPMGPAQAAQARRQAQTDRHEESSRRRKAFNTNLTETTREPEDETPLGSGFNTPREDVDEATALRHAALISRVSLMVNDSNTKMASFRSAVRAFRQGESTAKGMVDTIYNVLDRDAQATISVVKEVGQIFEQDGERDKARNILESLNGFRAEQEQQFPSLGGAPSGLGTGYAGITSGQVLRAKNATHTSGRSTTSHAVWARVEAAAASQGRPAPAGNQRYVPGSRAALASPASFPTLGNDAASSSSTRANTTPHSTPWSSGGAGPSSSKAPTALAGPQIRSINYATPKGSNSSKPPSQAAFPSLPASAKTSMSAAERKQLFAKPNAREESIRRITGQGSTTPPTGRGWGTGANGAEDALEGLAIDNSGNAEAHPPPQTGGSKKKGKQKQILFSVSARPQ